MALSAWGYRGPRFRAEGIGLRPEASELRTTLMTDCFNYKSPLGILGKVADRLFLEKYMKNFIEGRAAELKRIAETRK